MDGRFSILESADLHCDRISRSLIADLSHEPAVTLDPDIDCNTLLTHKGHREFRRDQCDLITDRSQEQCGDGGNFVFICRNCKP